MSRLTATNRKLIRDFGSCLSFKASSNQSILLKSGKILGGQTNFTISLWVKDYNIAGTAGSTLYVERSAGNDILKFQISQSTDPGLGRAVELVMRDDGGTLNFLSTARIKVVDGFWHHVVVTKSGTSVQFYVDGVADGAVNTQTVSNNFTDAGIKTQIGGDPQDAAGALTGKIDEVQLYTTALNLANIQQLFYQGGSISGAGLIGWYKLDEGTGTSTVDSSGIQSTATLQNTPTWSTDVVMIPRTTAGQRQVVRDFGTCVFFNVANVAAVTSSPWSATVKNISMGCWFRTINYQISRQPIITNGNGAIAGYALELSGNSSTDGSMYLLNHQVAWVNLGFKIKDNYWHHIFITIDNSNNILVYLDGNQVFSGGNASLGIPSGLSGFGNDSAGIFKGYIDDGRFYARVLNATEIKNLFYGIETSDVPANWYKFNEGSGTTAIDSGTNPLNATKGGATNFPTYSTDVFMKPRSTA